MLFSGGKVIHSIKYLQMFKLVSLLNIPLPDNSYLLLSTFESNPLILFPNHMKRRSSQCSIPQKIDDNRLFCSFLSSIGGILELLILWLLTILFFELVVFFFDSVL